MKREGGINALDEVLQRVNGLELVNGYLRISAKSISCRKKYRQVIVCVWVGGCVGVAEFLALYSFFFDFLVSCARFKSCEYFMLC